MVLSVRAAGLLVAYFATSSLAFPALSDDAVQHLSLLQRVQLEEKRAVKFDAAAQLVDVTGEHAWKAPDFAAGDQRGPCPSVVMVIPNGY